MANDERSIKQLDNPKQLIIASVATVLFALFLSTQAQAKVKSQNIDAKGKEGAKQSFKQKSTKKFALKTPLKAPFKNTLKASPSAESILAKSAPKKTTQAKLIAKTKPAAKTKFLISKNTSAKSPEVKAESPTQDLFKAFASNQQNQMMAQNSKPTRRSGQDTESKSKKMPNLLPTSSNDSQRAASMLEADSGVHGDEGYTRTQIVDAPVRKPAAVAAPKTPERVAITFEHEAK